MKIGFLFGAGAEIGYGLPSGGDFALNIFRQDASPSKNEFKKMRETIDPTTQYAANWLPDDYKNKNISSFGKTVFEAIIKDTIEHNRNKIVEKLNCLDDIAEIKVSEIEKNAHRSVREAIKNLTGRELANMNMRQSVAFVDAFSEGDKLFSNNYFSALLFLYKSKSEISDNTRKELGKIIVAILQLQIGALSEKLSRKINDSLFSKKDDDIDLFDDLGDIIKLNYQSSGMSGLDYLMDKKEVKINNDEDTVLLFAQKLIEAIYATVLDYKSLIDANWHSLYCPQAEWAKFCKISIFLLTVREYIKSQCDQINKGTGYYHDLKTEIENHGIDVSIIATTNYNSLIADILGNEIAYMNGSTEEWYDPYINRIGTKEKLQKEENHFLVPLIFTQSGTKPMTAIEMSIRYVTTYEAFKKSDIICIVGFGFNKDDEHINGLFRSLIEDYDKKIVVVEKENRKDKVLVQKEIGEQLKVRKVENIEVILVDNERNLDNRNWIMELKKMKIDSI